MAIRYNGTYKFNNNFKISSSAPIDDRTVVDNLIDLTNGSIASPYTGLLVYVVENESFYVLIATEQIKKNYRKPEYWKKIGEGNISENGTITINKIPESGNGISISKSEDIVREYISSDEPIKANEFYTSNGLNTYDDEDNISAYEYIDLSNGGDSYIRLFDGENINWIKLNIVDDSLGFTIDDVKILTEDGTIIPYTNDTPLLDGVKISFGKDVDFTGFEEKRPNDDETYIFGESGSSYTDVDIYKESSVIDVYAHNNGDSVKILTELDKSELEDKIDNLSSTIMIDPDGDGEKESETLQDVIVNMNNAITQLENIEINYATEEDINNMYDEDSDEESEDNSSKSVINIKTLKYFRDKLNEETSYTLENEKPMVIIGNEKQEIATTNYVDDKFLWLEDLD